MASNSVTITVDLKAKLGCEEDLKKALTALIVSSRGETGCRAYDMLQSADDPQRFLLYMTWRDEEAFQRHTQSPCARLRPGPGGVAFG